LPEPVTERNPGVLYGLGNLVENAIDFAVGKVTVDARWSNDAVKIVIADDGMGFPAHVLEQLGEPFVTTRKAQGDRPHTSDEHAGMGLGFFIAKTLLERSGAQLKLANRPPPEDGAVVTVVWPRAKFEHVPQKAPARAEKVVLAESP
jgi:two-component system sensor histidine kinase RegB